MRGTPVCQKMGMILENKVVQKLKLQKMFYKEWSPKLIFLNNFSFEKFSHFLILALFDEQ